MKNEIARQTNIDNALSVDDVCGQINLVQQVLAATMKKGCHYDTIPGCGDKLTLLQPGAQKLALTFRLNLETDTEIIDYANGHREYRSKTIVCHIKTGERLGTGSGSCSTMESKYRYRAENTGEKVPPDYWKNRDQNILGGNAFFPRKQDGVWYIFHQVEYSNPADYYNTCLKISEKRSKVAAVLNVTAASDIFIQEIENDEKDEKDEKSTEAQKRPPTAPPQEKQSDSAEQEETITGIVGIVEKPPAGNRKFTAWEIQGKDKIIFNTANEAWKNMAQSALDAGLETKIKSKKDKYRSIVSIEVLEPNTKI